MEECARKHIIIITCLTIFAKFSAENVRGAFHYECFGPTGQLQDTIPLINTGGIFYRIKEKKVIKWYGYFHI